jgi:hypothetical protein
MYTLFLAAALAVASDGSRECATDTRIFEELPVPSAWILEYVERNGLVETAKGGLTLDKEGHGAVVLGSDHFHVRSLTLKNQRGAIQLWMSAVYDDGAVSSWSFRYDGIYRLTGNRLLICLNFDGDA